MIPVVSGVAVAERIRGISDVPIMMITALSDEPDRIRGLEAGADDYVPSHSVLVSSRCEPRHS